MTLFFVALVSFFCGALWEKLRNGQASDRVSNEVPDEH